jgi:hypothetical protein
MDSICGIIVFWFIPSSIAFAIITGLPAFPFPVASFFISVAE